jgi:hypothetical protein
MSSDEDDSDIDMYVDEAQPEDEELREIVKNLTPARKFLSLVSLVSSSDMTPEQRQNSCQWLLAKRHRRQNKSGLRPTGSIGRGSLREKRKREEKAGQSSGEAEKVTKKLRTAEPDTVQKVTIYVEIHPPAPQQSSRVGGKKSIRPIIKKGPAFFTLNDDFDEFKKIIAKTIPCKPKLLPVDKMEWRYEKPANDPKKPLVSAEGFEAMNISLLERKTGFVLYISIPPPKQDDAVSLI